MSSALLRSSAPSLSRFPILPSTSSSSLSFFHTSLSPLIKYKASLRLDKLRSRKEAQALAEKKLKASQPDPITGFPKGQSEIWENCELNKLLLDKNKIWSGDGKLVDKNQLPNHLNFGLDTSNIKKFIFSDLPETSTQAKFLGREEELKDFDNADKAMNAEQDEKNKSILMGRILDLRNANSRGIYNENVRRIINRFGFAPGDTGCPEVQAAILTYRIQNLHSMLLFNNKDIHNRRSLRMLIGQRARILKYLKRRNMARYIEFLPRVGLTPDAVEGELERRIKIGGKEREGMDKIETVGWRWVKEKEDRDGIRV